MEKIKIFILLSILSIIVSCPNYIVEENIINNGNDNDYTPETIEWEDNGNDFLRYYTNDDKNNNQYHWCWKGENQPIPAVKTVVKRILGDQEDSYGVIFCYQEEEVAEEIIKKYLAVMINGRGDYRVVKFVDYNITTIIKSENPSVNIDIGEDESGINVENIIRVEYDTENNKFSVYFNEVLEFDFIETELINGRSGYFIEIATKSLIKSPVDIRVKNLIG